MKPYMMRAWAFLRKRKIEQRLLYHVHAVEQASAMPGLSREQSCTVMWAGSISACRAGANPVRLLWVRPALEGRGGAELYCATFAAPLSLDGLELG